MLRRSLPWLLSLLALAAACGSNADAGDDPSDVDGNGGADTGGGADAGGGSGGTVSRVPMRTVTLSGSDEIFRNPERGFYRATSILEEETLDWIEDEYSLYFSYVRLDDYRDQTLPADFLQSIQAGIDKVRAEDAKLILRFAYNFGPYPDSEPDASLSRVQEHIEQLTPLLEANVDVIAVVQAGFIGAWGEWHTSTNGLTSAANKRAVWEALIDAVPSSRAVQLRYPGDLLDLLGDTPLTADDAWDGSPAARTGHHNDCFLANDTDEGTYPSPSAAIEQKAYLSAQLQYVPMGGETCAVEPPRSECAVALEEMELLRFSYVNVDYHEDVVASWTAGGCRPEMDRRLGYRLAVEELEIPEALAPGATYSVTVRLRNDGFAAPINARPVHFTVPGEGADAHRIVGTAEVDVRSFLPGQQTTFSGTITLPEGLADGSYPLHLWLPDDDETLATRPAYSIRLANQDAWDAASGSNSLTELDVRADAAR
ncbi:MAG TPA: DUF4832 domain-containing protein [Polyangiaceae bacterium]|nr:DUF4832 domain-containing protein [Polyangiaceae bacterium]